MGKKAFDIGYRFFLGVLSFAAGIPVAKGDFLRDGRQAFMNYDFETASENYEKYAKSLRKTPDAHGEAILEKYMRQLEIAESSLDNVQRIEIIDRLDVPAADFFKYIKLPSSAGKLEDPDVGILRKRDNQSDFVFSTESGDALMWSENDEAGQEVIMHSERLMDGSWELPAVAGTILNDGGNARNPFMLTDGITLYYSSDGEGSMGGYDLFVATKDPVSGEYRQPMGLGYPFNSPFNEYMIAIDEDNGIGWWVTDRNGIDGQVSVYVFKTNDIRKNYIPDEEEDIIALARVADISLTQNSDTDYASLRKDIDRRSRLVRNAGNAEFLFPLPEGRVARQLADFRSAVAKRDMQQYLKALDEHHALERQLTELRRRYHATDKRKSSAVAFKHEILELEKQRDWQSDRLKKMRNTIITEETKK